jgi:hypothetical protein
MAALVDSVWLEAAVAVLLPEVPVTVVADPVEVPVEAAVEAEAEAPVEAVTPPVWVAVTRTGMNPP